jgi:hypothetical protein
MRWIFASIAILCASISVLAQPPAPLQGNEPGQEQGEVQEEIIITGQRLRLQLRRDMRQAEIAAYDLFNQFNDDKRFEISCNSQTATGTRIESEELMCQPNFEMEAMRGAGQDYLTSLRNFMDPYTDDKNPPPAHAPAAAIIESLQPEYRAKMREVAEQHPEFLEALIIFTEKQARYREALGRQEEEAAD